MCGLVNWLDFQWHGPAGLVQHAVCCVVQQQVAEGSPAGLVQHAVRCVVQQQVATGTCTCSSPRQRTSWRGGSEILRQYLKCSWKTGGETALMKVLVVVAMVVVAVVVIEWFRVGLWIRKVH